MNYDSYDAFDSMGDVIERTIPAIEQKKLIQKFQNDSITTEEKDILMGSLYNLVIRISRSFAPRFPDRSLEDLINDGLLNLWLRLPSYSSGRSSPSTFTHIVVQTAFCKELKRMQRRSLRRTITVGHGENTEEREVNVPHMSLSNFMNSEGHEYEPDALGVKDEMREQAESLIAFNEMMVDMYQTVCHSVQEYKILNHLLNVKILPNFGGGRRRKSLSRVAEIVGTKFCHVERIANRVKPFISKHDFLPLLSSHTFKAPMADKVFSKEVLDEYFNANSEEDIWTLMNGHV